MFLSYKFTDYLKHVNNGNEYRFRYQIVDDNFIEVGESIANNMTTEIVNAVIDTYSKRGLSVANNLVAAITITHSSHKYIFTVDQMFAINARSNPRYQKYRAEIDKLLLLT